MIGPCPVLIDIPPTSVLDPIIIFVESTLVATLVLESNDSNEETVESEISDTIEFVLANIEDADIDLGADVAVDVDADAFVDLDLEVDRVRIVLDDEFDDAVEVEEVEEVLARRASPFICGLPAPLTTMGPFPCTLKSIILPVILACPDDVDLTPFVIPTPFPFTLIPLLELECEFDFAGESRVESGGGGTELLLLLLTCVDTFLTILGSTIPGPPIPTPTPTPVTFLGTGASIGTVPFSLSNDEVDVEDEFEFEFDEDESAEDERP